MDLAGSDVDGGMGGWWESVIRQSSSPSSCGILLLSGRDEQAAFLFLVALVTLVAAGYT